MNDRNLSTLRQEYAKLELSESSVSKDPISQFALWFDQARDADLLEPNAMTLATADKNGSPSARVVLLKGYGPEGFYFYTNYASDKAKDISDNPQVSVVFLFLPLERQVRINGKVVKVSRETSAEYFHGRPRGSQIGAWVSSQSKVISGRDVLEDGLKEMEQKFKDLDQIPLPEHWGGYLIIPESIEFWQGRPNRLHDRIRYTKTEEDWKLERLAP